jgi:uncharacterized protein YndB with AHSA1/START domain
MEILNYEIEISAPVSSVWRTLTERESYHVWAKAFSPNSTFEGKWVQGGEMTFIDPDMGGTKAVLEIVDPGKRIRAKHIALVSKEGGVSASGEMADKWLGTTEDYVFVEAGNASVLKIEIKTHADFGPMFQHAWPGAMANIKALSEGAAK